MTQNQKEAQAKVLEAAAGMNESYMRAMESTTERTDGRLGHLNNPSAYAAHQMAAARKRLQAANLRATA